VAVDELVVVTEVAAVAPEVPAVLLPPADPAEQAVPASAPHNHRDVVRRDCRLPADAVALAADDDAAQHVACPRRQHVLGPVEREAERLQVGGRRLDGVFGNDDRNPVDPRRIRQPRDSDDRHCGDGTR